ncbi:MAG: hypothetical protein ACREA7_07265 [Nitrosotalea sp.]
MKSLHLYIIMAIGVAAIVTLGATISLSPHTFNLNHNYQSNSTDTQSSMLSLSVSVNSTEIKVGQGIAMDIALDNTSPNTLVLNPQHNWPLRKWSMGPCLFHLPFGMALLQGNYSIDNMTEGERLPLYPSGVYMCRTIDIDHFIFQPSSNKATIEINDTNYPVTMQYNLAFNGFYQGQKFQPFTQGMYTVIGEDRWGHVSIHHFMVTK